MHHLRSSARIHPDVINEDVDILSFPGYAFERRGHLCIQPMVAANTRDAVLNGCPLLDRTTSNEDSRAAVSKCTGDAPPNAEGSSGDDRAIASSAFNAISQTE